MKVNFFWFRRDLRIHDNTGFYHALTSSTPVIPLFIFDAQIIEELPDNDPRVQFIHQCLADLNKKFAPHHSSLLIKNGSPEEVWTSLLTEFEIEAVYTNHDYEPYARERDEEIKKTLNEAGVAFYTFKDQVVFEKSEVVKDDGNPYVVYTPYKRRWLGQLTDQDLEPRPSEEHLANLHARSFPFPSLEDIDKVPSSIQVRPYDLSVVSQYDETRNDPVSDKVSYLSPHLRFGTVSPREMARLGKEQNETFLSELIWREFFMQILWHFPHVVNGSFRKEYDQIPWRNNQEEFKAWCEGRTGYPMVDAGMRQLNETGYMHNRVRMITASFLVKHLLIDWRWGEAYFAEKLLDFELSSNNGNWQWAAGSGCDAAPYFRVFNPSEQLKKFDPKALYSKRWLKGDYGKYTPIVDHPMARKRAIETYKEALSK